MNDEKIAAMPAVRVDSWHRTILMFFAILGMVTTSLTVRLPLVKELLEVSTSHLGIIIFVGAIGAVIALNISGRVIERIGTRPAILAGLIAMAFGVTVQASFAIAGNWVGYMIAGALTAASYGFADVAINVDGTAIERRKQKSLMPRMHAAYSLGALAGAGIGTVAAAAEFSLLAQIAILAAFHLGVVALRFKTIPAGIGQEVAHEESVKVERHHWLTPAVWFLSISILAITIGEGSAIDWLALGVVEGYNESAANAGIAFTIFNLSMTLTRFFGGNLADRFGKARTIQALVATGVLGILMIIFGAPNVWFAWIGAALWAAGVALGFPLLLSAAGEAEHPAKRVSFVAAWGYGAFLAGPALLGFLGEAWGILNMYFVVAGLLATAFIFSSAAGNKRAAKN